MSYGNGDANISVKQSGKDFVLEVCQESLRNRCSRLESQCRYAHPPPNIHIVDGKVQCCADFLKGRCHRVNIPCRYFHPPQHLAAELTGNSRTYTNSGQQRPTVPASVLDNLSTAFANAKAAMEVLGSSLSGGGGGAKHSCEQLEVCRDYLRGRCQRDDCRFAHPSDHVAVDLNNLVNVCIDFLNGRCSRTSCRYFHPPAHLAKAKSGPGAVCRDFLRGRCQRDDCRFSHPTDPSAANSGATVCRDFLVGKCNRTNCRYVHTANQAPADTSGSVCRDFLVGRCNRTKCKFIHSAEAKLAEKQSSDVCKDFLNGKCNRTICRFYHPPSQPASSMLNSAPESASMLARKRAYPELDNYGGYSQVVDTSAAELQYAAVESYEVPAKRPFTNY